MSLLPYVMDRYRPLERMGLRSDDDILSLLGPLLFGDQRRGSEKSFSSIKTDKTKFQVDLDVHHFNPEEISVKIADGSLIVEGNHEERKDEHGWVARKFIRRYVLPEGCSTDAVQSRLSSDGVLTVLAPLACAKSNERIVPIIQTGPVKKEDVE